MEIITRIFDTVFFGPIVNLLVFVLRLLEASHIPFALGFAIIILTILIRILIWPFISSQLKSAKKMADLKPHLDVLKGKHKDDKQALAAAQMALYKEHGVNPAGGCLPALIQIPVVIALYQVISSFFYGADGLSKINSLLYFPSWHLSASPDHYFFGIDLTSKISDHFKFAFSPTFSFSADNSFLILIPIITGLLQFIQSKMMTPAPVKKYPSDSPKEKKEKETTEDAMVAMQGQMLLLMPIMIGYFAYTLPAGLALYWNTFTLLGIYQQYRLSGWGGVEGWIKKLKLGSA